MSTDTFPQFNRFPLEIRNMVWALTADEPRIIHLYERYARIDRSAYSQVRSDGQVPDPMVPLQGYQCVAMSMDSESRMARALRTFGYTIEMWLEQNQDEWQHINGPSSLPSYARRARRYMPSRLGAVPEDEGEEESFYVARYMDDFAEVQWIDA